MEIHVGCSHAISGFRPAYPQYPGCLAAVLGVSFVRRLQKSLNDESRPKSRKLRRLPLSHDPVGSAELYLQFGPQGCQRKRCTTPGAVGANDFGKRGFIIAGSSKQLAFGHRNCGTKFTGRDGKLVSFSL